MSLHINTPRMSVVDPRGLPVRPVDYCRDIEDGPVESRINRTLHDPAGRAVKQWDPRLWLSQTGDPLTPANLTQVFALDATVIRSDSVDAGTQIELKGLATQTVLGWDSRQTLRKIEHDNLLRPVAMFEEGTGEPPRCVERLTYGHPGSGDQSRNHFGQLIRHDHPAGSVLFSEFAISGACTEDTRHFTLDPLTPDWPEQEADRAPLLEHGAGATSRWRHGALGDVLAQTDARDNRHTFALTVDGRLHERRLQLKGEPERVVVTDIRYNAQGNVTRQTAGNGVQTTRTYRPEDDRLLSLRTEDAHGLVLQHLSYEYDRMGNVLNIEDKALPIRYFANQRIEPVSRFEYDSLYQLIKASAWEADTVNQGPQSMGRIDPAAISNYQQTYEYDSGGNLRNLIHVGAQSHGRKLQPASYSNRSLRYTDVIPGDPQIEAAFDRRGNLLQLEPGRLLSWNLRNQLQSVSPVERASEVNDKEVYLYDGSRQRVRKIRFLLTNARILVADVRYLPGLELRTDIGTGGRLQVIIADNVHVQHWESQPPSGINNRYRYQHIDHLDSVSLETADDGARISRETFHPFGTRAWQDGELSYKFVRYSGKERDATGLYYYGFRYYIPCLQRWSNPDPADAVDGHNRFRAMRNSPMVYRDPDGRDPEVTGVDRVYHDLADHGLVHPVQAAGMQPVRLYFEHDPDPDVQAYRREIPVALTELGARSDSLLNTHQAHVIAAARTRTASPSGAVLYHSGELLSSVMTQVVGEGVTSRVMGPMSVAFNSPVEDPQVLANRRGAVASTFKVGGQILMHSAHPALQVVGAAGVAMGNVMEVSEAQTRIQYRMLTSPASVAKPFVEHAPKGVLTSLAQSFSQPPRTLFDEQQAIPSVWAQQLFNAGFASPSSTVQGEAQSVEPEAMYMHRSRRGSHHG
ncbi:MULTISPECIES: RHS repeat domain-containing protein [unclassified Pseudomonas]|uniref:RHS repeat domain-containing protein n=1 Tax=unclassified Pseudomonas TaxID=196821 RepID=UPI000A1EAE8C|nr:MULTISPECIES: RHS repeat-associated core domain-containing protein [unclassified Pseudomonas]